MDDVFFLKTSGAVCRVVSQELDVELICGRGEQKTIQQQTLRSLKLYDYSLHQTGRYYGVA